MPRSINLTGESGKNYNLEEIASKGTRTDKTKPLTVQIWYWNPDLPETNEHKFPNPPAESLSIGNIWLSKMITPASDPANYKKITQGGS